MKLYFLFGANFEREELDVLNCWSEFDLDANHEGWVADIEEKKKDHRLRPVWNCHCPY